MKILFIAPYMTKNAVPLLSQCKAGFGYMVYDIAAGVAEKQAVEALLYNYRYDGFRADHIGFVESSWKLFLRNIKKCCSPLIPLKLYGKYRMQLRTFVRLCYGWLVSGYYRDVIDKGNYDVVHIHGCGFMNEYFIGICKNLNVPFVVTLHGLNSFSDSVKLEPAGKKYEKNFLRETLEQRYNMTVIASGIKRTILDHYGYKEADNIHIVNNAFSFTTSKVKIGNELNVRDAYKIPIDAKILLYVGNICERKNQKQIISAYNRLPDYLKESTYILFLGRLIEPEYKFEEFVNEQRYKEHFKICGNIDKELMPIYYESASGVALMSRSEGFGLSLIEALHFSIPCMSFDFIDAYNDIYDECCMIGVHDIDDTSVSKGFEKLLTKNWDKAAIQEYSKRFEAAAMADNYINVYKDISK